MSDPRILVGDCRQRMAELPEASVDAIVTDPPYGLEFMGKEWDRLQERAPNQSGRQVEGWGHATEQYGAYGAVMPRFGGKTLGWKGEENQRQQTWHLDWLVEALRVLKPGGHLVAFGGTRTWHRLACAVEDAGFEIRDTLAWIYGSGFSKSWNFKTMHPGPWCDCEGGEALPLGHADHADLSRVRGDVLAPAVARSEGEDGVLLAPLQRGSEGPGVGGARPQGSGGLVPGGRGVGAGEDDRRAEPGMEGRHVRRAGEGLPHGADAGAPEGPSERLRGRAPAGHGADDRAPSDASRGGAPHQRGPGGQPAGEPAALPGPHEPLDDRALRDGPVCSRCGGLDPFYKGAGTGLKPAFEPVILARRPLDGTVAANVTRHGVGALNIDGCRIGWAAADYAARLAWAEKYGPREYAGGHLFSGVGDHVATPNAAGRWPANVILDEEAAAILDEQTGELTSGSRQPGKHVGMGYMGSGAWDMPAVQGDSGGGSRFFYVAKADASERPEHNGTRHPTVKPLALMRWLVRLVTPPGGVVLDPFLGSGTTAEAALLEGFDWLGCELTTEYVPLVEARIARVARGESPGQPPKAQPPQQVEGQLALFDEGAA